MPLQKPISCIISRSYSVRILRRCASSSLPCVLELDDPLVQLLADRRDRALRILSAGVTNCFAG